MNISFGLGLVLSASSNADLVDNHGLSSAAGDLDINRGGAETSRVLEEVVVLALSLLPGAAAIGGNLDALDGLVGVDDLDGEPVGGGALLVVQNKRGGDAALDELVRGLDDAVGAADCLKGIGEEIEVASVTFGALVNDLLKLADCTCEQGDADAYHGLDSSGGTGDLDTGTAASAVVPLLAREGSSENASGEGVG
ncbi:hypothetical protein HG530_011971 [Fusarium avenaceum]|nr:hypothetical protein HG530_011971 [Fusarium avenaceum]